MRNAYEPLLESCLQGARSLVEIQKFGHWHILFVISGEIFKLVTAIAAISGAKVQI